MKKSFITLGPGWFVSNLVKTPADRFSSDKVPMTILQSDLSLVLICFCFVLILV